MRLSSRKFVAFTLAPALTLVLAAETTVRLKYFFAHAHDWNYITAPLSRGHAAGVERFSPPQEQQTVVNWPRPCVNGTVYSAELHRDMPRTFDGNCFRGDHVEQARTGDEYRVVFLGGSTVEDGQSDQEMMTAQFKRSLPQRFAGKTITVVNAGKPGFQSSLILQYWESWVGTFSPDLVLYYEGWNEIPTDVRWTQADQNIAAIGGHLHKALFYRSMLYTYLVEKVALRATARQRFWQIDLDRLRSSFSQLVEKVRNRRARFVFVTQVIRFPRRWKGVDTFDRHAVETLLAQMRADPGYEYDMKEVSALNQRLTVSYTIELCRQLRVPVVNILEPVEAVGEGGRDELFVDLGHLTVAGDRLVGGLIAKGLPLPGDGE